MHDYDGQKLKKKSPQKQTKNPQKSQLSKDFEALLLFLKENTAQEKTPRKKTVQEMQGENNLFCSLLAKNSSRRGFAVKKTMEVRQKKL